jgi:peroxiredoxin
MKIALFITILSLLGFSVTVWLVLYQLIKQRGRILLRSDDLEQRLRKIEQLVAPMLERRRSTKANASEMTVGTILPDFRLLDLSGQMVGLDSFRGQCVLLIYWNPHSTSCLLVAQELANLHSDFRRKKVHMVLISTGDQESTRHMARKHGLKCPILLFSKENDLEAFHHSETLTAYLLDENGCIIYPRALGTDSVLTLAREAIRDRIVSDRAVIGHASLAASRIERKGLKAGTAAPLFTLTTIYGKTISLEEYRGRRLLLIFTSPHCTPCDHLAPHLVSLHRRAIGNHLALLMIGRGDLEQNRVKAEAHGFEFPVALQKHWEISKLYGIFFTPVAFLINEAGTIVRNVANGTDEILALIEGELLIEQELNDAHAV